MIDKKGAYKICSLFSTAAGFLVFIEEQIFRAGVAAIWH
jgi:hypothetical protein